MLSFTGLKEIMGSGIAAQTFVCAHKLYGGVNMRRKVMIMY